TRINLPSAYPMRVKGSLVVSGSQSSPVVFKPTADACDGIGTKRQDWPGIEVVAGATASIEYAEIHCAAKGVHFNGGDGSIRNSQFLNNYTGIRTWGQITPKIFGNTISGSEHGIYVRRNSNPRINDGNVITENRYGIYVDGYSSDASQ
ncbi:right-handed parallel beta-helix repeat-containing protein, partial [uncultured Microbulbifer sp.]|uniref:right-handed parallel beta-helix repeat-containing protein n=1 Tax=uncultured Microbulbifer sp. TaxID=348147 RepID=UPI0026064863